MVKSYESAKTVAVCSSPQFPDQGADMSDTKVIQNRRRTFLLAVGAGGAATAAAIAAKVTPPQRKAEARGTDGKSGKGYQETAHIRNYYRTTQV